MHYNRWLKHGDPLCKKKREPKKDAGCREQCIVDQCDTIVGRHGSRGMCTTHYSRWRRIGEAGGVELKRKPLAPNCAVDGCNYPVRTKGHCNAHYLRIKHYGDATYEHSSACLFCGVHMEGRRPKKYCSAVCARMWFVYKGNRPQSGKCVRCGGEIDLQSRTKAGQYKRVDTKMCAQCKRARATRHGYSPLSIVAIHGSVDCGICGLPVDLSLKHPDGQSASIDHIVPFAHGGSNEPENLQLAHLHCNHVKSDSGWKRGKRVKNT